MSTGSLIPIPVLFTSKMASLDILVHTTFMWIVTIWYSSW